jgi:hypothetical protein
VNVFHRGKSSRKRTHWHNPLDSARAEGARRISGGGRIGALVAGARRDEAQAAFPQAAR